MGVAKCTASRIPSMEFPDITKARREPACGAKKTAPIWGEEKVQSPEKTEKKNERFLFVWKKPVVPVGNHTERAFPLEIFQEKGIPSEVILFCRFSRNDRKINVPFATTSLFAHRARSTNEPKNVKIYPFSLFKLIQNCCRV